MKRGFILAILSLFIVITFGGFGMPEKGHAVAPYSDTTTQNLFLKGVGVFNTEITVLQNNPSTTTPQTTTALIKLVKYSQSIFVNVYDTKIKSNNKPLDSYISAADASVNAMQTLSLDYSTADPSLILSDSEKNLVRSDYGKSVIQDFSKTVTFSEHNDTSANSAAAYEQSAAVSAIPNATPEEKKAVADKYLATEGSGCTTILTSSITDCVAAGFNWFIQHTLLTIGGWFLTMGGFLLDWSISSGILNFKQWVPDQITGLWKLVRDVLYLCIVFIGFYLAFMYIIGRDEKFKKFIPWLIIFALFVNFSLPITRAMIDMSNIVALNIYNSAVPDASTGAGTAIMNKIGLSTLLMDQSKNTPSIAVSLLSVIFVFFAAWVFFQVAILMMIRTVTLTLCLICSPFLLIDSLVTIPAFGEHVKKIRSIFFNQLFMADVFMIIFFITLQVMNVLKPKEVITNAALASTGVGNIGLIFGIFMMMILLHFMLKITKSMSGEVGSFATGMVNNGVGLLAGGAMGVGAMAGRASIGRLAAKARDSSWVKNNQDSFLGRKAYDFSHSVASSSMDARNSGIAQKYSGKLGMNIGTGGKTGYQQNLDAKIKDRMERGARITTINKDGTVNQAGVEAKRNFYDRAGGVMMDKDKIRESLMEKDREDAEKDHTKIKAYNKNTGDKKQNQYYNEKDNTVRAQLIGQDHEAAIAENRDFDHAKAKIENASRHQDEANAENLERDHKEAIAENKKRNTETINKAHDDALDFIEEHEKALTENTQRNAADRDHGQALKEDKIRERSKYQDEANAENRERDVANDLKKMVSLLQNQNSQSSNFATDAKNTNKNEDIIIGRGGKTDEKTTSSGIILPT